MKIKKISWILCQMSTTSTCECILSFVAKDSGQKHLSWTQSADGKYLNGNRISYNNMYDLHSAFPFHWSSLNLDFPWSWILAMPRKISSRKLEKRYLLACHLLSRNGKEFNFTMMSTFLSSLWSMSKAMTSAFSKFKNKYRNKIEPFILNFQNLKELLEREIVILCFLYQLLQKI